MELCQYFVTMCVIKNLQNPNLFQYLLKYFVANRSNLNIQKLELNYLKQILKIILDTYHNNEYTKCMLDT